MWPHPAWAGRPLVTDDAGVVGAGAIQIETWSRLDRNTLQHWLLAGVGLLATLELTVGAVHGLSWQSGTDYSLAAPVLQAKVLLHAPAPAGIPGLAVAGGAFAPFGRGALRPPGWDYFVYGAMTGVPLPDGRLAIHVNGGLFGSTSDSADLAAFTWGVAAQGRIVGDLFGAGEVFSGDPYLGAGQGAGHLGLRYFVTPGFQLDATLGVGLWGVRTLPVWGTVGLRLARDNLWLW